MAVDEGQNETTALRTITNNIGRLVTWRAAQIWPYVHLPVGLLILALFTWRILAGFWFSPPSEAAAIGGIDRVAHWGIIDWYPPYGAIQSPASLEHPKNAILNSKTKPLAFVGLDPTDNFATRLVERGLINRDNYDPALPARSYSILQRTIDTQSRGGSWNHGRAIVIEYTAPDQSNRLAFVSLASRGADPTQYESLWGTRSTARVLVFEATAANTLVNRRVWTVFWAADPPSFFDLWKVAMWFIWLPAWFVQILYVGFHHRRVRARRLHNQCTNCGYSLAALDSQICPACGAAPSNHSRTHRTSGSR